MQPPPASFHGSRRRLGLGIAAVLIAALAGAATRLVQDQCGPFTDVSPQICPYVAEMYYLGITAGTSATTYSPDATVTRGQAAVFVSKGVNQALARSSRRAALGQWWTTTPHYAEGLEFTALGAFPGIPCSDGADVWVPDQTGLVQRVRASDGRLLESWNAPHAAATLCAMGRVFVTGLEELYVIDPGQAPGDAMLVVPNVGRGPHALAFDGSRIWTANPVGFCACDPYPPGSVSIVTPGSWSVQVIDTGNRYPWGILFDGAAVWSTDQYGGALLRFDSNGTLTQIVQTGHSPRDPVFDGANIWVPNYDDSSVTVVRASDGAVLATLTGNGLAGPVSAAFDGSRVLVLSQGGIVSLWNAQSLMPIGNAPTTPYGGVASASDGIQFWLTLSDFAKAGGLGRF